MFFQPNVGVPNPLLPNLPTLVTQLLPWARGAQEFSYATTSHPSSLTPVGAVGDPSLLPGLPLLHTHRPKLISTQPGWHSCPITQGALKSTCCVCGPMFLSTYCTRPLFPLWSLSEISSDRQRRFSQAFDSLRPDVLCLTASQALPVPRGLPTLAHPSAFALCAGSAVSLCYLAPCAWLSSLSVSVVLLN